MKTFVVRVAMVIAVVALWQTALWGSEAKPVSVSDQSESPAKDAEVIKAPAASPDYLKEADSPKGADAPEAAESPEGSGDECDECNQCNQCAACRSGCGGFGGGC
jgi:hypothetical protein